MGILGRLENWLEKRKSENMKNKPLIMKGKRGLNINKTLCPKCRHNKSFSKNSIFKCSKCGFKWKN